MFEDALPSELAAEFIRSPIEVKVLPTEAKAVAPRLEEFDKLSPASIILEPTEVRLYEMLLS